MEKNEVIMHIIFLRFSRNRSNAPQYSREHVAWLNRGIGDGVFLIAGALRPNLGGAILTRDAPLAEIERRVNDDPFVREDIVSAEIHEFSPSAAADELLFLLKREGEE